MGSVLERFLLRDPTEVLLVSLGATVVGIVLLLVFIFSRRAIRKRYFATRGRRNQHIRKHWDQILSGEIPPEQWFFDPIDHALIEGILLDRMDVAGAAELGQLQEIVRRSGLLDKRVREVRTLRGWDRRQSLLALSRTRSSEGVPALADALRDADDETAVDAVHALGQVGTPQAADAILERMSRKLLRCPPQVLQGALLNCYRNDPAALFTRVLEADDATRPDLARVLSEVANPQMSGDVLRLAADPLAEVRASSARLLAVTRPHYALPTLTRLAADKEWFVRLRAAVALGDLADPRGIPALIQALCDSNRLVRLRAASSLVRFGGQEEQVLQLASATGMRCRRSCRRWSVRAALPISSRRSRTTAAGPSSSERFSRRWREGRCTS